MSHPASPTKIVMMMIFFGRRTQPLWSCVPRRHDVGWIDLLCQSIHGALHTRNSEYIQYIVYYLENHYQDSQRGAPIR